MLNRTRYDPDTETLEVEFSGGGVYTYEGVPISVYNGLLSAPSAGQYFHRQIKGVYG